MQQYPKVLVVGVDAWRTDGTSHTLSNIFSCWDPSRLALIYAKSDFPFDDVCNNYYRIGENDVLHSVFMPWKKVGNRVSNTEIVDSKSIEAEHRRYQKAHQKHSYIMTMCREIVWCLGHWRTKRLRQFVEDFSPDVVFFPVFNTVYMGLIERYVLKVCRKPVVCYMADDAYSYNACDGILSYIHRFLVRRQVKFLVNKSEEVFVISELQKKETDSIFGTDSKILTKGVECSKSTERRVSCTPIRIVYTGNLLIGREKTILSLVAAIKKVNSNGIQMVLDIYSPTVFDQKTMEMLNCDCVVHHGAVPRSMIDTIQQNADIVLFVEALHGKESEIARLSFSTKITDYLSKGKCILAIGKREIAPIDYFIKNDSAVVACSEGEIYEKLLAIVSNPEIIKNYEEKALECAIRNHNKRDIEKRLIDTICKVARVE